MTHNSGTHAHEASDHADASADACYGCGKCTAGCPVAAHMDLTPHRIFRLVQMGQSDRAARCEAMWLCVSCFTCVARCPQSVNCVAVMDALREKALREELVPAKQLRVLAFQRTFLENVRRYGRLNELDLVARFKMVGFFQDYSMPLLFKDALLVPGMVRRGKLHMPGRALKDSRVVERIFARCGFGDSTDGAGDATP